MNKYIKQQKSIVLALTLLGITSNTSMFSASKSTVGMPSQKGTETPANKTGEMGEITQIQGTPQVRIVDGNTQPTADRRPPARAIAPVMTGYPKGYPKMPPIPTALPSEQSSKKESNSETWERWAQRKTEELKTFFGVEK